MSADSAALPLPAPGHNHASPGSPPPQEPPPGTTPQRTAADEPAKAERFGASETRFHTVFNHSPQGQNIIDSDLTIRQANPSALVLLGLAHPDELVGHKIIEFAHPDFRADWHRLQQELWAHKTPYFVLETCLVRPGGTSLWCQVTSVLFQDETGEMGYTILEDIDARKTLEAAHQRLYEAQETMLHLMAHDLKTPIANIQLLVNLLERDAAAAAAGAAPAGPAPETALFLTMIKQCCAEAQVLLQDVLYLGQLESTPLEKYRLDVNDFLTAQLAVFRVAAQQKGIALTLEVPAQILHAALNPDKFGRVMANLLANALKFTPAGGRVTVSAHSHAGGVRLSVQDTGVGIPTGLQAHVFDKFSRAQRDGLYGESTTGLGLFIAHQIVRRHGGTIWLESREHEGTTFFIDLS
jgi:two-component system, OmpR family, sensor histidine kinase VicK